MVRPLAAQLPTVTLRDLRHCYRNWLSVAVAVGVLRRVPRRVVLAANGQTLGAPGTLRRVFALADAVGTGWTAERGAEGFLTVRPPGGPSLDCRWTRGYDLENAVEVFRDRVYPADVAGSLVVDVGAGIGDSPLFFAANGASRVLAFEPNPESREIARRNVARTPWASRIELRGEALAAHDGTGVLRLPAEVPSAASLSPVPAVTERWRFDAELPVPTISLDRAIRAVPEPRVGLLKVDCQGAEYEVLGAVSPATLARVDRIVVEFGNGVQHLASELTGAGFLVESQGDPRGYLTARRPPPRTGEPSMR
ncbi:MAG: FkbM family methyltransferase [Thermoplasmata archaeon]|nr:FkbM family methyltransferase [Thermoplasmata archaeon]